VSSDFELHRRAQDSIAQGYLTNSKRPETFVKGVYPTHVARGQGCYLWDHKGKKYIDFICGLGTNLLGYGNESVSSAIRQWLPNGWSHSFGTHLEIELAEKLKGIVPFVDLWRFLKTGTDACLAAIKIARAATGRSLVLSEGYHGWSDDFVSLTEPALGVPRPRPIKTLGAVIPDDTAAVIVEPVVTDASPERLDWLRHLRTQCDKVGALLVFDEVITGLRFPKWTVSSYAGVTPDLIVLGKALANGMPLAAVGGKKAVMQSGEWFISSTYAGEVLSLAAAAATITTIERRLPLQHLWDSGRRWLERFNAVADGVVRIDGYPTRGVLVGASPEHKALFMQEACMAGMLFGPSWFWNFPHAECAFDALGPIEAVCGRIRRGEVRLEGEMPRSPFAQQVRSPKQ
jgi:glutamate-1-semialdehyde aminotransferase